MSVVKINSYIDVTVTAEEEAIALATIQAEAMDTVNVARFGSDVITKLYYICPQAGKIIVAVSEADRVSLKEPSVILSSTAISDYALERIPASIIEYKELIIRKGANLSAAQITDAAQFVAEEASAKVFPTKIPVVKIIDYNVAGESVLVLPSVFGLATFRSLSGISTTGNATAGGTIVAPPQYSGFATNKILMYGDHNPSSNLLKFDYLRAFDAAGNRLSLNILTSNHEEAGYSFWTASTNGEVHRDNLEMNSTVDTPFFLGIGEMFAIIECSGEIARVEIRGNGSYSNGDRARVFLTNETTVDGITIDNINTKGRQIFYAGGIIDALPHVFYNNGLPEGTLTASILNEMYYNGTLLTTPLKANVTFRDEGSAAGHVNFDVLQNAATSSGWTPAGGASYWYGAGYIEVKVNEPCRVWRIGSPSYPYDAGYLEVFKDGVNVTGSTKVDITPGNLDWEPFTVGLTPGIYRFQSPPQAGGDWRIDTEWFFEKL